jgi:hypothetical protein
MKNPWIKKNPQAGLIVIDGASARTPGVEEGIPLLMATGLPTLLCLSAPPREETALLGGSNFQRL